MNSLINTDVLAKNLNEYHLYECVKKSNVRYIALVHCTEAYHINDAKILIRKFPCVMPLKWSLEIIKQLDNATRGLQLSANMNLPYLIFTIKAKSSIEDKVGEIIADLNQTYIWINAQ